MATQFKLVHSNIGFAGKVNGWMERDAMMFTGGDSLSSDYKMRREDMERTFVLIKSMMAELGGDLIWGKLF